MGMRSVEHSVQARIFSSDQSSILAKQTLFTASGGHLVSFAQEDAIWVAVDRALPEVLASRVQLPAYCIVWKDFL